MADRAWSVVRVALFICLTFVPGGTANETTSTTTDDLKAELSKTLKKLKGIEDLDEKLEALKNDTEEIKLLLKNGHGDVNSSYLVQCQSSLHQEIVDLKSQVEGMANNTVRPTSCREIVPESKQGVYEIWVRGWYPRFVYCDDDWTVIQRRMDGSVDFYKGWDDYKDGFGNATGEYWLGLKAVHEMTSKDNWQLQVDLGGWENETAYALYSRFGIGSDTDNYPLSKLKFVKGTAGDSISQTHRKRPFSTHDSDHDLWKKNCAETYQGAWWYTACLDSNLNGKYKLKSKSSSDGIVWKTWKGYNYSVKSALMKIRPV